MNKKRLEFIEGYKGFACFCVMMSHFIAAFCNVWITALPDRIHNGSQFELLLGKTPLNLFYNGNFGVRVFFISSGFVLSYAFFRSGSEKYLKRGVVKRYFRLVLPVVVVNIIAYLLMKFGLTYHQEAAMISKSYDWLIVFNDFEPSFFGMLKEALIGNFFLNEATYVSPLWTMTYEMYGSMLVFAFLALFGKEKVRYPLYVIFLLLFRESNYSQFMVGVAICDIMVHGGRYLEKYQKNKVLVWITFLVGLFFSSYPSGTDQSQTMYRIFNLNQWMDSVTVYHFFGAALMFFAILNSNALQKFFEQKPFAFLGKYSFGLYLVHWPVMISLSSYIVVKFAGKTLSYYKLILVDYAVTMLVIVLLAVLLTKFVDSKGIKLANKVADICFAEEKRDGDK